MSEFAQKAQDFEDKHDAQADKGLDKAGEAVDKRTGGQHSEQVDKAVDEAQKHD